VKEVNNVDTGLGLPDWQLSLCLLGVWILIFLTLIKGIKSSGKVSYFTALFPYAVLIVLLVRGITLPGSWKGIRYLIEPKWEKILDLNVGEHPSYKIKATQLSLTRIYDVFHKMMSSRFGMQQ
jgi:solute carrier family 6 amino acid transporter-like protein 5/7/9/14